MATPVWTRSVQNVRLVAARVPPTTLVTPLMVNVSLVPSGRVVVVICASVVVGVVDNSHIGRDNSAAEDIMVRGIGTGEIRLVEVNQEGVLVMEHLHTGQGRRVQLCDCDGNRVGDRLQVPLGSVATLVYTPASVPAGMFGSVREALAMLRY